MSDLNQLLNNLLNLDDFHQQEIPIGFVSTTIEKVNDSEDEDENDRSRFVSILKEKTAEDDDELEIERNLQPRRLRRKSEEDDENQHVPETIESNKTKQSTIAVDENDRQNPTYVPRKGRFFEHDDRTLKEEKNSKQPAKRFYSDSDGKWQHDLFFLDQQALKFNSRNQHRFPRADSAHHDHPRSQENRPIRTRSTTRNDQQRPNTNIHRSGKDSNDQQVAHHQRNFTNRKLQTFARQQKDENQRHLPNRYQNDSSRRSNQQHFNGQERQETRSTLSKQNNPVEYSKRYSNMRQSLNNAFPQRTFQPYEQNDWPQAPPPPTSSYFRHEQLIPSQVTRHHRLDARDRSSPQVSRYVPMMFSQTTKNQRLPDNQ